MGNRNQKAMTILIGIFLFIFVVSIVYAASAGVLNVQGSANFSELANVQFVPDSASFVEDRGNINEVAQVVGPETLLIKAVLDSPGDSRTVAFQIENTGNVNCDLVVSAKNQTGLLITTTANVVTEILAGETLPSESTYYTVTIEWDESEPDMTGEIGTELSPFVFVTLDWSQQ